MKYENLFKIHIPEPCHEDWNKMTRNEQGAYCRVCAKTVVDFSDRSQAEIQKYLTENIENKICGRFRVNQLSINNREIPKLKVEKPKFEFPGFLMPVITPFRACAMAVMLFASAALAGCGNSNEGGGDERLAGTVAISDTLKTDTAQYNFDDSRIQGGISIDRTNRVNRGDNSAKDSACSIEDDVTVVGKIRPLEAADTLKADTSETMIKGEIQQKTHGVLIIKENNR